MFFNEILGVLKVSGMLVVFDGAFAAGAGIAEVSMVVFG
jgi:hypothetical protein